MTPPVRTIEARAGAWLRLVIDEPPGNLLSLQMIRALDAALAGAADGRKWVTLEGGGTEFSFGARIQEHVPGPMERVLPGTHALVRRLLTLPCATAALVQGRCLGAAFELALACDLVIATEDAVLGLPEISLSAFPPAGAALLPLRVGASRAANAILTGDPASASEWLNRGAVAIVAPRQTLIDAAGEWFDAHLGPRSRVAIAAAAEASRLTLRALAEPAMAAAERLYLDRVLPSQDAGEGVRAFIEKRPPRWSGR